MQDLAKHKSTPAEDYLLCTLYLDIIQNYADQRLVYSAREPRNFTVGACLAGLL